MKQTAIHKMLGDNLREWRHLRHLSQVELARMSQISRTQIANIESGKTSISLELVWRLCAALQCEVHELVPTVQEYRQNQ